VGIWTKCIPDVVLGMRRDTATLLCRRAGKQIHRQAKMRRSSAAEVCSIIEMAEMRRHCGSFFCSVERNTAVIGAQEEMLVSSAYV